MNRLYKLEVALLSEIKKYGASVAEKRDQSLEWEQLHMASCARLGTILAQERGMDPDLAGCACAIHDYGRIVNGKQEDHAEFGYEPVMVFLRGTGLFNEKEIQTLGLCVKKHSLKAEVGTPLEEIVKDADLLDYVQYGHQLPRLDQQMRYERLQAIRRTKPYLR